MGRNVSIRLTDEEERIIEEMIKNGDASNRTEAIKLLHYLEMAQLFEAQGQGQAQAQAQGEAQAQAQGEVKIEKRFNKTEEALANILVREWEELKRLKSAGGNDYLTQLGLRYIEERLQEAQVLRFELERLKKKMDMMDVIKEHLGDIIEIAKKFIVGNAGIVEGGIDEELP